MKQHKLTYEVPMLRGFALMAVSYVLRCDPRRLMGERVREFVGFNYVEATLEKLAPSETAPEKPDIIWLQTPGVSPLFRSGIVGN